jgi:hypothetical protein
MWGGTSACYPIDGSTTDAGRYASLYIDDANHFHIAYYDATNKELKYAYEVSSGGNCGVLGSAQCVTIGSMPANYHPVGIAIAEDAGGYPMIASQSTYGSLMLARPIAALGIPPGDGNCGPGDLFQTWYCQTIDRYGRFNPYRNADFASIDVHPSGWAAIAYNGFITASGGNLRVSRQHFLEAFLPMVVRDY